MIGLCDLDLQTSVSNNLCPPNLEIMKLATYYKTEENLFCNLISLNGESLEGYDIIYCFSEQYNPIIPDVLKRQHNVVYGGTGFTRGVYIPFDNAIIDYTLPKTWIYKNFLKDQYNNGIKTKIISSLLDNSYYRQYAGDKQLPMPPILPKKRLYIYDRNFFTPTWKDMVEEASKRKVTGVYTIHPIICKTFTDYFSIRNYSKIARSNDIILDTEIPLSDVHYMLKKYKNLLLGDITQTSNVFLPLGGTFKTNLQYYKDLIYKLNLLYSFWSQKIPIKFKYIPPDVGTQTNISNLLLTIAQWSQLANQNRTIDERIHKKTFKSSAEQEKEILLKFHP